MFKKILGFFIVLGLSFSFFMINVKADMGPKATADIEVVGVNQPFYFDILIYRDYDVERIDENELEYKLNNYYQEDYPLDLLNGYQDMDGYASRTLYSGPPANIKKMDTNTFQLGYFNAPVTFKIIIILEDDTIIASKVIHRKLFNAKMTYDLSNVDLSQNQLNVGIVTEEVPYTYMGTSLVIRVIITIAIEVLILLWFGYRSAKSFKLVGFTNLATQTLLTAFMIFGFYVWGSFFGLIGALILGEIGVFAIEFIIYNLYLKEKSKTKAISYAFVANLATLILSVLTMGLI